MNEDNIMEDYLGGEEFNVGSRISAMSKCHGEIHLDQSMGEQDVSLLVSPSFSDYVGDKSSEKSINKSKSKSRCFPEEGNDMDIFQKKIDYDSKTIEETTPETNILLDDSCCPSLGLGSVESKEEAECNSCSPQIDDYVFKASSYRNIENEATSKTKKQIPIKASTGTKKSFSDSSNNLVGSVKNKKEDKALSENVNTAAHSSKMKIDSKLDETESRSTLNKPKSNILSEFNTNFTSKLETSSIQKGTARRNTWNHDINDKLAGVTYLMDSLKGNTERKRSKSFENSTNTCESMKKYILSGTNAATDEDDYVSNESPKKTSTSLTLREYENSDCERIKSLEELKKKYPSPKKENKISNVASSSDEKKNVDPLNPIGFIRELLSPPKFLSPSKQQQEKFKSIIDNISVKNDINYEKLETPQNSSNSESKIRDENDNAGIGHWRLSLEIPRANELKLNVSPISLALSNSEKEDNDQGSIDSSEQILGEKILEREQANGDLAFRQNASSYFSPAESSDYSTFSSKDIGSVSVEVSNITRKQHSSRTSIPVSRLQSFSGRRLSIDKMNESKAIDRKSPLTLSENSDHAIPDSSNRSREVNETPPHISFTSIPDLSSAKKKVGASSRALVERLKGASQRRTLQVSRSGKQFTTSTSAEFDYNNKLQPPTSEDINSTIPMKIATTPKKEISSGKNSCFKPFKARPLPSTTSVLGHGGQLGVPKIPKKRPTNPLSPKLGARRRNQSPSRAIQQVRAAEKARKKILKQAFGEMPEYKSTNIVLRKKLPPEEDPYIPFKARPIETNPKPLRSIGNLSQFVKNKDDSSRKITSETNIYSDGKRHHIPLNHHTEKKHGKSGKSNLQCSSKSREEKVLLKEGSKQKNDENISYKIPNKEFSSKKKQYLGAMSAYDNDQNKNFGDVSGKENMLADNRRESNEALHKPSRGEGSVYSYPLRDKTKTKPYRSLSKRQRRSMKHAKHSC